MNEICAAKPVILSPSFGEGSPGTSRAHLLFRGTFSMHSKSLAKEPGQRIQDLNIAGDPSPKRGAQDDSS